MHKGQRQWVGRRETRFLYDIVADKNAGLDVDRMDYLLRDAMTCNVESSFNQTSIERIIKYSCVVTIDGEQRIAIAEKVC